MNRVNKEIELKKSSKNKKLRKHSGSKVQNQTEKDLVEKISMVRHSVEKR